MPDNGQRYTRESPSPRYRELTRLYAEMHCDGQDSGSGESPAVFQGFSLVPHAETIGTLIDRTEARTILDYGAGKGLQYKLVSIELPDGKKFANIPEYWGVERVACYDPGVPTHNEMPGEMFDGIVCTDVLEHCPAEDLPWILEEMIGGARRFVFATVALYLASKTLPNGENAHCTIRPPDWWKDRLARATRDRPELAYRFELHWCHEGARAEGVPGPEIIEYLPLVGGHDTALAL